MKPKTNRVKQMKKRNYVENFTHKTTCLVENTKKNLKEKKYTNPYKGSETDWQCWYYYTMIGISNPQRAVLIRRLRNTYVHEIFLESK